MNEKANVEMVRSIQSLIQKYQAQEGCEMQAALRDVLTDIRHAAYDMHLDIDEAFKDSGDVWESEMADYLEPGMEVDVDAPPDDTACWNNEFRGTIVKVAQERKMYDRGRDEYFQYCTVKDQEDNHYDIDWKYIHPAEED